MKWSGRKPIFGPLPADSPLSPLRQTDEYESAD